MSAEQSRLSRQDKAKQTKKHLFDAAYSLLQEKDFSEITINDIVSRANVSVGTFYLYYTSKLDVYYQTYVLADDYFCRMVAPKVLTGTTLERLLIYFEDYAHYNSDYTSIRLTKLLYNGANKCFLRRDDGMYSVLDRIIRFGLSCGELDDTMSCNDIFDFLMHAVRGLVYDWCISDGAYNLQQATVGYVTRLYRSIQKSS